MNLSRIVALVIAVVGVVLLLAGYSATAAGPTQQTSLPDTLSGTVINAAGYVSGAIVQVQGTPHRTETNHHGAFTLTEIDSQPPIVITAWAEGHYSGSVTLDPSAEDWPGAEQITIQIDPLPMTDNLDYDWIAAHGEAGSDSCVQCHREVSEWALDLHAQASVNPRFLTLYAGTNVDGEQSPLTEMGLGGIARPPDPDKPYYGPGFLLDNPTRTGNCAACHTPMASKTTNVQNCAWSGCHTNLTMERAPTIGTPVSPMFLKGAAAEGISCDFCHKVRAVILDPATNLPFPDMPGILSMQLARPPENEQVFFGTLPEVAAPDSYLPLLSESEFCAPCHFGVFGGVVGQGTVSGGTVIYNSYGEWLDSPYSDPVTGQTCQDCHMPVSDANWFVYAEQGGLERDYVALHNHTMPGAADEELLQNSVTMISTAERAGDQLQVEVNITNDQTGHHIPTGVPIRSMILFVGAFDANGERLTLLDGPVNPAFSGDYGDLPGKTFAKVLQDDWTGAVPTAAYWRPVTIVEDSRLAAFETNTTQYTFAAPSDGTVTVEVQLIFRRAFAELMLQKGWDDPDIVMEYNTIKLPAN